MNFKNYYLNQNDYKIHSSLISMKPQSFMREAIKDANKNKHHFGAVVVINGKIISKAG